MSQLSDRDIADLRRQINEGLRKIPSEAVAEKIFNQARDVEIVRTEIYRQDEAGQKITPTQALYEVAMAYEAWEGRVILTDDCWRPLDGFSVTQELYDEFMQVQAMRNNAVKSYRGELLTAEGNEEKTDG